LHFIGFDGGNGYAPEQAFNNQLPANPITYQKIWDEAVELCYALGMELVEWVGEVPDLGLNTIDLSPASSRDDREDIGRVSS
jgi:hypothetical protein